MAGAHVRPSLFLEVSSFNAQQRIRRFYFHPLDGPEAAFVAVASVETCRGPTRNEIFICCKRGMWYTLNGKQVWCTEEDSGYLLGPCACSIIVCAAHILLQVSCAGVQDLGLTLAGDKCRSSCRSCYYRVWPLNPRLHRDAVVQPQPCNRARLLLLPLS